MLDRVRSQIDQPAAVVDGAKVHARREQRALVQRVDLLFESVERGQAFFVLAQQHDRFDNIVLVIPANPAEPGLKTFMHQRDVAYQHRRAVLLGDDDVAEVIDSPQQPQRTHVDVLVAHGKIIAAGVGV